MSLLNRLITRLLRLPRAETYDIAVTRDIHIPMPDGVVLLADKYTPRQGSERPTLLVRSPYGRRGVNGLVYGLVYAAQGYQVLIQSCRGTAGSGGTFIYARDEHDDGLATIAWIKQQEWFSGEIATVGASYLGFVQWAVAAEAGPELKAIVPQLTSADFHHFRFQGRSFNLETWLSWSTSMTMYAATGLRFFRTLLGQRKQQQRLEQGYQHLPLREADKIVIHQPSQTYQDMLLYQPDNDYWRPLMYTERRGEITAPAYLMAGWYDLFLDWQLKDYQALRAAGRQPYLLIGPWTHSSPSNIAPLISESLAWLNAHLKGDRSRLREQPVRLFVMGANEWRDFADWPPPVEYERWHLQEGFALAPALPAASEPDHYRYDPADPTPAVGGSSLGSQKRMGPKDNRPLEARPDVLTYTSAPLKQEVEIIGPITADLYIRSSLEHTDFFARLCVVEASGKSLNLCDTILRLTPGSIAPEPDGSLHISIALWPTAYRFKKGQRFRLQISSGAHPRFARNLGTGEPLASATKLCVANQSIYHDPEHPSALVLPIYQRL